MINSFKEAVHRNIERFMSSVCTSIPAEVVAVDNYEELGVISVQPKIADVDPTDLSSLKFGVIPNVPVKIYSGGGAVVTVPIAVGDIVWLEFSMRNIQNWLEGDHEEISTPNDARRFHISDAVAYPCIYQKTNNPHPNPDDLELRYNDSVVRLKKDGNITISTSGNITIEESVDIVVNNSGNLTVNTEGNTEFNVAGNMVSNVTGNLEANVDGTTDIVSGGDVTIDTANTTVTGELRVDGSISVASDVVTDSGVSLISSYVIGNLGSPTSPLQPV